MRFLLFPRKAKAIVSKSTATTDLRQRGLVRESIKHQSQNSISNSLALNSIISPAALSSLESEQSKKAIWGQQCSENCGCVVRFTARIDTTTDTIAAIDYTCKSLIITKHPTTNERVVVTTSKGRPIFQECKCTTLQSLSNAIVQEIQLKPSWKQLYSDTCNFETTRSSPDFRQAVLYTQNLPSKDTSCFDLVEEAVTAMIKGYMPIPRHSNIVVATKQQKLKQLQKYSISEEDDDEESEDIKYDIDSDYYQNMKNLQSQTFYGSTSVLPFGNIVEQMASSKPSILSLSSTLSMYDQNLERQQQREDEEKQQSNRQSSTSAGNTDVRDWESYVDYQYQEEEKSSA